MTTVATAARATPSVAEWLARLWYPSSRSGPAWLEQARQASAEWATSRGSPTRKDEDWKYTPLGPLFDVPFERAQVEVRHRISTVVVKGLAIEAAGIRLVFVNGLFAPELSSMTELPEGCTVTNLASVLTKGGAGLEHLFAHPFGEYDHMFTAVNTALAEDGAFIHLPAGTVVTSPIELLFLSDASASPTIANPRSLILVGSESRATVVETYAGTAGAVTCTNAVTQVVLDEGARFDHFKIQNEPNTGFHLALLDVRQGPDSQFSSGSVALGSAMARNEVHVRLEGEGAELGLDGLYLPRDDQFHDNPVRVEHAAPGCTSRQLYKGIANGRGHGVFNGHIIVWPGALGTDASQINKNLLLSDRAEIDTRPRLEIFTDDVQCTHGAAVGALDADALFYLRSRGVSQEMARALLTQSFAREPLDRIRSKALRTRVESLVAIHLSPDGDRIEGNFP